MKGHKKLSAFVLACALATTSMTGLATPTNVYGATNAVTVSTQKQLDKALKDKKVKTITIKSKAKKSLTIKKGSYTAKRLVIQGANLTVKNSGKFKSIKIADAVAYKENTKDNSIQVTDNKIAITVNKAASVKSLTLAKANAKDTVTVNGVVKKIDVIKKTDLKLTGGASKAVVVNVKAADSKLTSSVNVTVNSSKNVEVTLNEGAEESQVNVTSKTATVAVKNNTKKAVIVKDYDGTTKKVEKETSNEGNNTADSDKKDDDKKKDESNGGTSGSGTSGTGSTGSGTGSSGSGTGSSGSGTGSSGTGTETGDENADESTGKTISSLDELTKILSSTETLPEKLSYKSEAKEEIEIPVLENAKNVELLVNAPNATITNNSTFKKIKIKAIAKDTWIEQAQNNSFDLLSDVHMVVSDGAIVDNLHISTGANEVNIENKGTIQEIGVSTKVKMDITGTNFTPINVKVDTAAADATVRTSIPVAVQAEEKITLQLRSGAEKDTSVTASTTAAIPTIEGIGIVPVKNQETGTKENVFAATNPDLVDSTRLSKISGMVQVATMGAMKAVSDAAVYLIPYDGSSVTAENVEAVIAGKGKAATTNADGHYEITDISAGNYTLIIVADKLQTYIQSMVVNGEQLENNVSMVEQSDDKGSVTGHLYDAVSGFVQSALKLNLRKGSGSVSGEIFKSTTCNPANDGFYEFKDLPVGVYTIQVVDVSEVPVYSDAVFSVTIADSSVVQRDMTISKVDTANKGQVQFILRWLPEKEDGSVSSDLDSHLVGPKANGNEMFHTYYMDERYYEYDGDNEVQYADLDRDDTSYEGPETTTVRKTVNGIYHFYIYDYDNQYDMCNTKLTTSRPTVDVYVGDRLYDSYTVPDGIGTVWDVCTYDASSNTLTQINKIYTVPGDSSSSIGKVERLKSAIESAISTVEEIEGVQTAKILADAREVLTASSDYMTLAECYTKLQDLICATDIADVSFVGKKYFYANSYGDVPVIELEGIAASLPENLVFKAKGQDSRCEVIASDRAGYSKAVKVTNNVYGISKTYYIEYKQYTLWPEDITSNGKYLDWDRTEKDGEKWIDIKGDDLTPGELKFEFYDRSVTSEYIPSEIGADCIGTLKATCNGVEFIFKVTYTPNLRPTRILVGDKEITEWYYDWTWDEQDKRVDYIQIYGQEPTLSNIVLEYPEGVTCTYEPLTDDSRFIGKFTVTYAQRTKVYFVKYYCTVNE